MAKTAVNQFDTTPGNNTDVDGVGVGTSMTVDNTNDAFQHLMALIAQQMGEVGALAADMASAATVNLAAARGWYVQVTGTNTISSFGTVPAGKIFRIRIAHGATITYNAVSMILPNAVSLAVPGGDIVTMLSLGSGNWRMIDSSPASGYSVPAGSIVDYAGATAPGGWLFCNGQAISRTGYPLLFAAISTTYGAGNGSTTFNVPDFRGRAAIGDDLMGTSASGRITTATVNQTTRGGVGGAQTIVLTEAQMPSHAHTYSGNTNPTGLGIVLYGGGANPLGGRLSMDGVSGTGTVTGASPPDTHLHSYSGTTDADGSGIAHNNMQPSLITMKIIKT